MSDPTPPDGRPGGRVLTRRRLLATAGGGLAASLAGCVGGSGGSSDNGDGDNENGSGDGDGSGDGSDDGTGSDSGTGSTGGETATPTPTDGGSTTDTDDDSVIGSLREIAGGGPARFVILVIAMIVAAVLLYGSRIARR